MLHLDERALRRAASSMVMVVDDHHGVMVMVMMANDDRVVNPGIGGAEADGGERQGAQGNDDGAHFDATPLGLLFARRP
jgi:hypothetical protein